MTHAPTSGQSEQLKARAAHGEYSLHNFPDDPDADHSRWSIFHTTDSGGMEVASGMDRATADLLLAALATTAPVEASGSEREHGPKCWGKTSISDEMAHCYCGSTDSPPGETRSRLIEVLKRIDDGVYPSLNDRADAILALLSARPLTLGGQKGVGEGFYSNLLSHEDNEAWAALSTTPARAETQDEGAAGEPWGWAVTWIERPGLGLTCEVQMGADHQKWAQDRAANETGRPGIYDPKAFALYTHPSPTPAADAEALLPEVMTEEMERVWRGAFIHQGHKRHGRGAIGNSRRLKNPESCEQYAWRALRKHLLAALKSTAAKEGG